MKSEKFTIIIMAFICGLIATATISNAIQALSSLNVSPLEIHIVHEIKAPIPYMEIPYPDNVK